MFYSPSTNSFYDPAINEYTPEDAVEITKNKHKVLFAAQAEGKEIAPGQDGKPEIKPSRYHSFDGSAWIEDTAGKESDDNEAQRVAEIKTEQELSGFKKKSVGWAHGKIDQIFSGATTTATLRTACVKAFKMLVVLLLK